MSNARQGWNAAQIASERPLPGRKALAPVGEWMSAVSVRYHEGVEYHNATCKDCGYHVCSCPAHPPTGSAALRSLYDSPIRFGEPEISPTLLTYDQAVAACRDGVVVEVVGDNEDFQLWQFRTLPRGGGRHEYKTPQRDEWHFCAGWARSSVNPDLTKLSFRIVS